MRDKTIAVHLECSQLPEISEPRGWILYDGNCPICRRGVRRFGGIAVRRGYRFMPLQRRWVRLLLAQRPQPVADEMLLFLPGGRLLGGTEVYFHLARRVWWARPVGALLSLPGLHLLSRKLYARIAANRFGISRACGLGGCRPGS